MERPITKSPATVVGGKDEIIVTLWDKMAAMEKEMKVMLRAARYGNQRYHETGWCESGGIKSHVVM